MENLTQESERAAEKLLQMECRYWEQFLSDLTPYNVRPPRMIFLPKDNKTRVFAADGDVFCTVLLARALSFEELKAVMAHELWHIIKRHGTRIFLWQRADSALEILLFAMLLLIAFFSHKPGHLAFAASVVFSLRPLLWFFRYWYSRRQEYSADKYAASVADPGMLARALVKIYKANKIRHLRWWERYSQEHPHSACRLRYLRRWRDKKRKAGTLS